LSSMLSVVRMHRFFQKRMHASRNPSWDRGCDFGSRQVASAQRAHAAVCPGQIHP
jgi:hypothetical protein